MYKQMIAEIFQGHDARHIEAYMRLEHGTLDNLSRCQFENAARFAFECMMGDSYEMRCRVADSLGL